LVMKTRVGKLFAKLPVLKDAGAQQIVINQGPMKKAPAFAMGASNGQSAGGKQQAAGSLDTSGSGPLVQSLGKQQPTSMVASLGSVPGLLPAAQQSDLVNATALLPTIDQPTGLGTESVANKTAAAPVPVEGLAPATAPPAVTAAPVAVPQDTSMEDPAPVEATPVSEAPAPVAQDGAGDGTTPPTDPSNPDFGPTPVVELTGEIDPQHNQTAHDGAQLSVQDSTLTAQVATEVDYQEGEIMPAVQPEIMTVSQALTPPAGWNGKGGLVLPALDAKTAAALNSGIIAQHQAQIDAELAKETQARAEYDQKALAEQQLGLAKIQEENDKTTQLQIAERTKGTAAIDAERVKWRAENEQVMLDFDAQAKVARDQVDADILGKVTETNAAVETEYNNAKANAEGQTSAAQAEEARLNEEAKKAEGERKWYQKIGDFFTDIWNKCKELVTAVWEGLKQLVMTIIDAVKNLAIQLIDAARDLIKSFISAFAELLKTFITFALAAFPAIAERICALIDSAVVAIHTAIDQLATLLKTVVTTLLDAIGTAIKALIDVFAAIISAILTVIEFLAVGWVKIMIGIANLVQAAMQAPGQFTGQVTEELMGTNTTEALANEYPVPPVVEKASTPQSDTLADAPVGNAQEPASPNEALMARSAYTAADFDVPVVRGENFGPELTAEIAALGEGDHEIASFDDDQHGIAAIKAEVMSGQTPETATKEAPATESPAPEAEATVGNGTADPNRDRFTPDGQGMVGPFSVGERTKFVATQMLTGIKSWFADNWPVIVAALVGIIAGAILANILTGGAIMAALPLVMQLVGAYFAAEALANMAKYFGLYLGKSFPGNIAGGAMSLARALAIGSIELVFTLLFGGKAALKTAKNVAKTASKGGVKAVAKGAVAAAKNGVKSTVKAVGDLGKVAKTGFKTAGKNIVKGGKFALNGLKSGFASGVKNVRTLAEKLKELRFNKFRISVRSSRWQLEGKVNPWVLIANGPLGRKIEYDKTKPDKIKTDASYKASKKRVKELENKIEKNEITDEEINYVLDYVNNNPNTQFSLDQLLEKKRAGSRINENGNSYLPKSDLPQVEAKFKKGPDGKLTTPVPLTKLLEKLSEADQKILTELAGEYKKLLEDAANLKKDNPGVFDDYKANKAKRKAATENGERPAKRRFILKPEVIVEYNRLQAEIRKKSEKIGEFGGNKALQSIHGEIKHVFGGADFDGAKGQFDEIGTLVDGKTMIMEYKGGTSTLGYANAVDDMGNTVSAQQGTKEHYDYTIKAMKASSNKNANEAAEYLKDLKPEDLTYAKVRAIFDGNRELREFVIEYFDLEK
jgi:hypothetical protein